MPPLVDSAPAGMIDYQQVFEASPTPFLLLSPQWFIVAVNDAYLSATMTKRENLLGRPVFDVFPDNPDDPEAAGVRNLSSSLSRAMVARLPDVMPLQRYDIPRAGELGGGFDERWWSVINSPVLDTQGKVAYLIHRVEDVTEFVIQFRPSGVGQVAENASTLWRRIEGLETEMFLRAQELQQVNLSLHDVNEALGESETLFRTMADATPVLIWMAGVDKGCFWFNRPWLDFTGRTLEQERGQGWTEGVHAEDAERCWLAYADAFDRRQPFELEYRLRRHDGTYRWILDQGAPRFDASGTFLGYVGSAIDIEDRKHLAIELRDSMRRLQRFYDSGLLGVIYWNTAGQVVDANDKFLEIVGYTREDMEAGRIDWQAMTPSEYRHLDEASIMELRATGFNAEPFEKEYIRKSGERVSVMLAGAMLDDDQFNGVAFVLDITARKEAERALRDSEQRLRLATAAAKIGAFEWNLQTGINIWTPELEAMYGLTPGEFGRTQPAWEQLLHPEDRADALAKVQEALTTGLPVECEWRTVWPDGSVHWIAGRFQAFNDRSGKPVRLSGVNLDITARKALQERLRTASMHDPLTNLPNRALFFEYAAHALASAERMQKRVAVLFIDLDRFKPINDLHGHEIGDFVLKETAQRLVACTRQADLVGRLGGDEFVVLLQLPDTTGQHEETVVNHIVHSVEAPILADSLELTISASIGVARFPEHGRAIETLLHAADLAMYEAKSAGRAGSSLYSPQLVTPAEVAEARRQRIRHALETNALSLHYQPIVSLHDGSLAAAEGLIRMSLDDGQTLGAEEFVSDAIASGCGEALDAWVLKAACHQQAEWLKTGSGPPLLSVNISAEEVKQPDFPDKVRSILNDAGVPSGTIQLEFSEESLEQIDSHTKKFVRRLKQAGVKVAIDGFGRGSMKLTSLSELPFDRIKLEYSLVHQAGVESGDSTLPRLLIAMAQVLKFNVVWEGVETPAMLEALQASGTGEVQGFLFSQPLPAEQFAEWCQEHRRSH